MDLVLGPISIRSIIFRYLEENFGRDFLSLWSFVEVDKSTGEHRIIDNLEIGFSVRQIPPQLEKHITQEGRLCV